MPLRKRLPLLLKLGARVLPLVTIFLLDTFTRHEVAIAVFYSVLILLSATHERRCLLALAGSSIALAVLSLVLTANGDLSAGLVNLTISVAAIVLTTGLALRMQAEHTTAQNAQARLMRLARVRSLGALSASVAHEISQPLVAIAISAKAGQRWLAQRTPNVERARQALQRVLADAERAGGIVARVFRLTRNRPLRPISFDLATVVAEVLALAAPGLERNGMYLTSELPQNLPKAWADHTQIRQVIGNLLLNAMETVDEVPGHERRLHVRLRGGPEVIEFALFDSGTGVPPGMEEQAFHAFWTSKAGAAGVGLNISRSLVEANGGRLWAVPNPEGGLVFRFTVPVAQGSGQP